MFGLIALAVVTAVVVGAAWRARGAGETERFERRANGRARLEASLMDLNVRTGRRDLAAVAAGSVAGGSRWFRRRSGLMDASRLGRGLGTLDASWFGGRRGADLAVVWRCALVAVRRPARVLVSVGLAAAGAALVLLDVKRPAAVLAGAVLIYAAGAWLLEPMRIELDVPSRASVFLAARPGRALLAHILLPSFVVALAVGLCAAVLAAAGLLDGGELAAALAIVITAPAVTSCAGMSARRGGRLPQELLITAVTSDPSGGGLVLLAWLVAWPAVAAAIVYVPVAAIHPRSSVAHVLVSVALGVAAVAVAAVVQQRDPAEP